MVRTKEKAPISFKAPGDESQWRALINKDDADKSKQDEVRKSKEDLNNMLLSSLQMQNLTVLAGSGCSLSAKGPSMGDLWKAAVGTPASPEAVESARLINYKLSDANIESFLSKIEALLQIKEDPSLRSYLNFCKQEILKQCSDFLQPANLEAHKIFLHRLSRRRIRDQRLKVFTTNYDLCFEQAAGELGCPVVNGFSFGAPRRYDPCFFGYDIVRRPRSGEDLGQYLEGVFILYKLHGSVNWARDVEGNIVEKANPKPEEACLIYPANGKYQQSYCQPYLESMAQYLSALREPNTCLVAIGFGFNDDHLSEPLLAAVQSNPHLRLIIVDPDASEKSVNSTKNLYWPKFSALSYRGEDVWFIHASFQDFAQLLPDLKSLTPAEALMRTIKGLVQES